MKGEYSQARGAHWRTTVAGVALVTWLIDVIGDDVNELSLTVCYPLLVLAVRALTVGSRTLPKTRLFCSGIGWHDATKRGP